MTDIKIDNTNMEQLERRNFFKNTGKAALGVMALSALPKMAMANGQSVVFGNNWMSALDDSMLLSDLTLPATHDSASNIGGGLVRTQNLSISEQLQAGVRYLDLRICLKGGVNGTFRMHHGFVDLQQDFTEVLTTIKNFLADNPTETVMICVKQEYSSADDFTMNQAYTRHVQPFLDVMIHQATVPSVGEARGRMVVVTRCLGIAGINYRNTNKVDDYKINTSMQWYNQKWPGVKSHLFAARDSHYKVTGGQQDNTLWITTTSSTGTFLWPASASQMMLPALSNYFSDQVYVPLYHGARFGVILIDFANPMLIDQIAALNFGKATLAS